MSNEQFDIENFGRLIGGIICIILAICIFVVGIEENGFWDSLLVGIPMAGLLGLVGIMLLNEVFGSKK